MRRTGLPAIEQVLRALIRYQNLAEKFEAAALGWASAANEHVRRWKLRTSPKGHGIAEEAYTVGAIIDGPLMVILALPSTAE
jgi:hypothetical protein